MEYYYKIRNSEYKTLPPYLEGCETGETPQVMEMIYPKNNAIVYIPLELNGQRGKIVLSATHKGNAAKIFWHLDGTFIGTTTNFHQMAISPSAGRHQLTIVDDKGERLVQSFMILDKEK